MPETLEINPDIDLTQFTPEQTSTPVEKRTPNQAAQKPEISKSPQALSILSGLGLVIICVIGFFSYNIYSKIHTVSTPPAQQVSATPVPTPDPDRPISFLLMGYGGGGHQGGKLTDTIMLAYIEPKKEQISLISIPRDLWVSFPVDGETESYWKINAAYALGSDDRSYPRKLAQYTGPGGGGELAKYAMTKVTGLPIDHYGVVDFYSFKKGIDVLGGISVNVERSFSDPFYPIEGEENNTCQKSEEEIVALTATVSGQKLEQSFPCRFETLEFTTGKTLMDGATALKYIRSRHSATDGGDFNRAARQRQLIFGVKEKVFSLGFLPKIVPFISTVSQDFHTDLAVGDMTNLLNKTATWKDYDINTVALTTDTILKLSTSQNGQSILIPKDGQDNWESIQTWLQEQLNPPLATNSAKTTSSAEATAAATPKQ